MMMRRIVPLIVPSLLSSLVIVDNCMGLSSTTTSIIIALDIFSTVVSINIRLLHPHLVHFRIFLFFLFSTFLAPLFAATTTSTTSTWSVIPLRRLRRRRRQCPLQLLLSLQFQPFPLLLRLTLPLRPWEGPTPLHRQRPLQPPLRKRLLSTSSNNRCPSIVSKCHPIRITPPPLPPPPPPPHHCHSLPPPPLGHPPPRQLTSLAIPHSRPLALPPRWSPPTAASSPPTTPPRRRSA